MAAALHPSRNDPSYSRTMMTEYDFGDNRYPTLSPRARSPQPTSASAMTTSWENTNNQENASTRIHNFDSSRLSSSWGNQAAEQRSQPGSQYQHQPSSRQEIAPPEQSQEQPRSSLSYALPPGAARRVVERYSLDDNGPRPKSRGTNETKPTVVGSVLEATTTRGQPAMQQQSSPRPISSQGRASPTSPTNLLNASVQSPTFPESSSSPGSQLPSMMPLAASATYNPPVSPNPRAYAQQPTYVTQQNAPVYTPIVPPQEEVCVECAMRDQDMADVDVTSPGVWDRASDVLYEELKQREAEEEASGVIVDNPSRPRAKGGRLTEQNLKLWLSINPREPTSRQQTLNTYVKAQRKLLEAEASAHAQAMQEAKQLDNRMRDTYSQLRRSAYDMSSSSSPGDDLGGVRIKPPIMSPTSLNQPHTHTRSQSREITLLENGMIVEHVDVRKEEKEARERRKKEEKRARKSSKSSMMDVTSVISAQSNGALTENGLKPYSRYSQSSSARPTSVLTAPLDRPDLPRAYSQASFSDIHSLGSASPRRTRFFGMKNLSAGWRSQDSLAPSGMSGSMVDMHVALQREAQGHHPLTSSPIDLNTPRHSQLWPPADLEGMNSSQVVLEDKNKKKKGGLAKIWRIVTGRNEDSKHSDLSIQAERNDDDLPLAPPPPLSYLVNRGSSDMQSVGLPRHASTPSLPSVVSPKFGISSPGMSPPTAPSSMLPSPASLRTSGVDVEIVDGRIANDVEIPEQKYAYEDQTNKINGLSHKSTNHSNPSDLDLQRSLSANNTPLPTSGSNTLNVDGSAKQSIPLSREKSLPPLPPGEQPARILPSDLRPRTVYTYDSRGLPPGTNPVYDFLPPQAPFRTGEGRRQSFGGTSSRPNLGLQTMPLSKPNGFDSSRSFGPSYDEFGISRRSLGKFDYMQEHQIRSNSPLPSKRKSKFGLSSLLGKKNDKREEVMQENVRHQFPSMGYMYDGQDDLTTTGYATSASRHSTFSFGQNHPNTRMSMTSRKALEELVQQDAEFVAYRYPSNEHRLDLLR